MPLPFLPLFFFSISFFWISPEHHTASLPTCHTPQRWSQPCAGAAHLREGAPGAPGPLSASPASTRLEIKTKTKVGSNFGFFRKKATALRTPAGCGAAAAASSQPRLRETRLANRDRGRGAGHPAGCPDRPHPHHAVAAADASCARRSPLSLPRCRPGVETQTPSSVLSSFGAPRIGTHSNVFAFDHECEHIRKLLIREVCLRRRRRPSGPGLLAAR